MRDFADSKKLVKDHLFAIFNERMIEQTREGRSKLSVFI